MIELGFQASLSAATAYCPVPDELEERIIRIGGPRTIDVDRILSLQPDIVLANSEENDRGQVLELIDAGLDVWISRPVTTAGAVSFLWKLVHLFNGGSHAEALVQQVEESRREAAAAAPEGSPVKVFCPIWFENSPETGPWWMTINQNTYSHDVLRISGGLNVFADRMRQYPLEADLGLAEPQEAGGRDQRYPRITADEIRHRNPEVILLPDDPYVFSEDDERLIADELADTSAVRNSCIIRVDGRWISWYGMSTGRAVRTLSALFREAAGE